MDAVEQVVLISNPGTEIHNDYDNQQQAITLVIFKVNQS